MNTMREAMNLLRNVNLVILTEPQVPSHVLDYIVYKPLLSIPSLN